MPAHAIVLDVVSLTRQMLQSPHAPNLRRLAREGHSTDVDPPFPAVTCTSQATLTTGAKPSTHGIVANGWFDRERHAVEFWEQPSALVRAPRVWDRLKAEKPGATAAALFFQQSMYAPGLDTVLSPRPLHLDGGMVQWVYSKPAGAYEALVPEVGPFDLKHYWGPLAGRRGSEWIVSAAERVLSQRQPTLSFCYLPHLDYQSLRHGPSSPEAAESLRELDALVGRLLDGLERGGALDNTALLLLGEYTFSDVSRPVHLNRALREAGLLEVREIAGHEYLDTERSAAFAVVDHQVAHVYVQDPRLLDQTRSVLSAQQGVDKVLDPEGQAALGLAHERSGDLVAVARRDAWFTYYYWLDDALAPPFAHTVDIHRKVGFDPVELFVDPETKRIPLDASRVRGSHGRPAKGPEDRVSLVLSGADSDLLSDCSSLADVPHLLLDLLGARTSRPRPPARAAALEAGT